MSQDPVMSERTSLHYRWQSKINFPDIDLASSASSCYRWPLLFIHQSRVVLHASASVAIDNHTAQNFYGPAEVGEVWLLTPLAVPWTRSWGAGCCNPNRPSQTRESHGCSDFHLMVPMTNRTDLVWAPNSKIRISIWGLPQWSSG